MTAGPVDAPTPAPRRAWVGLVAWSALDLVLAAALVIGFVVALALALAALKTKGIDFGPAQAELGGLPALFIPLSLVGTLLAGITLWVLHRTRLPAAARPWSMPLIGAVFGLALGLQLAGVGIAALSEALGVPSAGSNLQPILEAFAAEPLLTLLATVVLAPIGEELVFRRVLLHRFAQAGRPWWGLVATSLLFASIHEPWPGTRGLLEWALTLSTHGVIGLGLGLLYLRSGRFDAVLLAHALLNASGMALLLVPQH